ncbi:MAG: hypothetical protein ACKV19_12490 [Verrucomicrobiales bacterium]
MRSIDRTRWEGLQDTDAALPVDAGQSFDFEILDGGKGGLAFTMTPVLTGASSTVSGTVVRDTFNQNNITFHNREGGFKSYLDNILIQSLGNFTPLPLEFTAVLYDQSIDQWTLRWNSQPETTYTLSYSIDLADFPNDVTNFIPSGGTSTTHIFANPLPGASQVFFRVSENP